MAKKYYYYVLVFSTTGPVYVTSINSVTKIAHWDKDEAPLDFSAGYAEDLVMGLNANLNSAVLIKSKRKIEEQPYNYADYDCSFIEKKKEEE